MSLFLPNIPQPGDNLDFSQGELLSNNQGLDTVFGIDHYKFSDSTANKGFHAYIHTVQQANHPTTTATIPEIYAAQDTTNLGTLDYSRGWDVTNDVPNVPTPLTNIQSNVNAITINGSSTITIFDFTGITNLAIADVYAFNLNVPTIAFYDQKTIFWNGTNITLTVTIPATPLTIVSSGSLLQLRNATTVAMTGIYWTISFKRIQL